MFDGLLEERLYDCRMLIQHPICVFSIRYMIFVFARCTLWAPVFLREAQGRIIGLKPLGIASTCLYLAPLYPAHSSLQEQQCQDVTLCPDPSTGVSTSLCYFLCRLDDALGVMFPQSGTVGLDPKNRPKMFDDMELTMKLNCITDVVRTRYPSLGICTSCCDSDMLFL